MTRRSTPDRLRSVNRWPAPPSAFDRDASNLFVQLIASRSEQDSVLVANNLSLGRWSEIFSDDEDVAAMIGRLVHHADVLTTTGDFYRSRQPASE